MKVELGAVGGVNIGINILSSHYSSHPKVEKIFLVLKYMYDNASIFLLFLQEI